MRQPHVKQTCELVEQGDHGLAGFICVFCGAKATLTNAHVLSQPIRAAFSDPFVTGSFIYRQSRQAHSSHPAHSHSGSWVTSRPERNATPATTAGPGRSRK